MTYPEGAGVIRRDGRRLTNWTARITRYDEDTDTLHGTITVGRITRDLVIPADAYRDDDGLTAALKAASGGKSEIRGPIWQIREALDVLAFPA